MPDQAIGASSRGRRQAAPRPPGREGYVNPRELAGWLSEKQKSIAERWLAEIQSRGGARDDDPASGIVSEFVHLLTSLLPDLVGPLKEQVQPLWQEAAELYGNAGALRGLASGEAVEEFQLLREVLIRQLFDDPPGGDLESLALREVLLLNRIVDDGVTFTGVGHTDSLFFALFQGDGVSDAPTAQVVEQLRKQVAGVREEHRSLDVGDAH